MHQMASYPAQRNADLSHAIAKRPFGYSDPVGRLAAVPQRQASKIGLRVRRYVGIRDVIASAQFLRTEGSDPYGPEPSRVGPFSKKA